jgi:hypothetical protein
MTHGSANINEGYLGVTSGFVEAGSAEYHRTWGVRRYDLTNLRGDLDNCTEAGRGFAIWGSIFLGAAIASFLAWLGAMASATTTPLWLRLTLGYGALVCLVLGITVLVLDWKFARKARNDLTFVKRRVDSLISMFDEDKRDE